MQAFDQNLDETGGSLTSDGYEDVKKNPLLNAVIVSPQGAKFHRAINTAGQTKDSAYIGGEMIKLIEDIGPTKIVQVR
jgi:hypothetical protein